MAGGPGWDNRSDDEKGIIGFLIFLLIIFFYILGKVAG